MINMNAENPIINELIQVLSQDYTNGNFVPILEADVVGYMYHLLISKFNNAGKFHLDTRICTDPKKRFDLVIGEVDHNARRPCIEKPEFIIEAKSFPSGFTNQQHRVHYLHVIGNDVPKLANIKEPLDNRYILLFDEVEYLEGHDTKTNTSRITRIVQVRDKLDPKIKIIHVKRIEKRLEWELH